MTKEQTLKLLDAAKLSHKSKMEAIKLYIVERGAVELSIAPRDECHFSRWLHQKENDLHSILGDQFYKTLESIYARWYEQYHKIYNLFYAKDEPSLLSKVFGSTKRDILKTERAKLYYRELSELSSELLSMINSCERRVHALSDTLFKR